MGRFGRDTLLTLTLNVAERARGSFLFYFYILRENSSPKGRLCHLSKSILVFFFWAADRSENRVIETTKVEKMNNICRREKSVKWTLKFNYFWPISAVVAGHIHERQNLRNKLHV